MSSSTETKESTPILVEFVKEEESGALQPVSIRDWFNKDKSGLEKKSNAAVDKAMRTIQEMSNRVSSTIDSIQTKPQNVEVAFGIKFDAELDVLIAKVGTEASMTVTLKWESEKTNDSTQQKERPAPSVDSGTIPRADPRNPYNDPTLPYYNPDLNKKKDDSKDFESII